MITGDPALDLWLTTHSHLIAAAVCFLAFVAMVLPGLAEALKEES